VKEFGEATEEEQVEQLAARHEGHCGTLLDEGAVGGEEADEIPEGGISDVTEAEQRTEIGNLRQAKEEAERRVAEAAQQIAELKALLSAGGGVAAVRNMQVRTLKPRLCPLLRRNAHTHN
jgi:hypothetical protein